MWPALARKEREPNKHDVAAPLGHALRLESQHDVLKHELCAIRESGGALKALYKANSEASLCNNHISPQAVS